MRYYIRQQKKHVSGPYELDDLRRLIKAGKVRPEMEFSEDRVEWIWGIELAELFPRPFRAPRRRRRTLGRRRG